MHQPTSQPYQASMLPNVDYCKIDDADDAFFSLVDLEYGTLESCTEFFEELKLVLLNEKFMPVPEFLIAHLCAYLGAAMTVHTVLEAEKLEEQTTKLVQQQAKLAYQLFSQYPINRTVKNREQQVGNLNKLRQVAPGSIINQTLRLERVIRDILSELEVNLAGSNMTLNKNEPQILCSQETLTKLVLYSSGQKCAHWREQLDGLSDNYVINQLAIQIGWVIGYLVHLSEQSFEKSRYLDYGVPIIRAYRGFIFKLMKSYAEAKHDLEQETIVEELLTDIGQLLEKTHAQIQSAPTDFQKQYLIAHAGIEKTLLELLNQEYSLKVILFSVFYFWFTLADPLYNKKLKTEKIENPLSHMPNIIHLVRKKAQTLPEPNLTSEIKALNEKMQKLKQYISSPEKLDEVSPEQAAQQTPPVNTSIHTVTSEYLQQNIHPEAIANALFCHWLRLSVFFGISEKDWQKMDYYIMDILGAVKQYISTIHVS